MAGGESDDANIKVWSRTARRTTQYTVEAPTSCLSPRPLTSDSRGLWFSTGKLARGERGRGRHVLTLSTWGGGFNWRKRAVKHPDQ